MNEVRRYFPWAFLVACALLVAAVAPRGVSAQSANGKILGTITDQQGGVIPNAKVTVINTATQVTNETVSDAMGNFQVLSLPLGTYRVSAECAGFKKTVSEQNTLEINQSLRVDLKMPVGEVTEVVTVEGAVAATETVNSTLGQSVTARPLVNLPLNGRNVFQLALLQPGVSEGTGRGMFSVAGGRDDAVTYLLDGGLNNNLLDNLAVFTPNPDTIAEFRILTSNYTAEYGRNGSGIVSVVTKSGTNSLHGSAFEFLRNDFFNANSFFNNRDGAPREILKRNQFGFTVGGPAVIPGIINGRDKFFFSVGYQGQRLTQQEPQSAQAVFTPAELNGDFSKSNASRTGPDSNVVSFLKAYPYFQSNPTLAAQGIIDPSKIGTVAKNYIKAGLIPTDPSGLVRYHGAGYDNKDELTARLDGVLSTKDRLSVTLGASRNPNLQPFYLTTSPGFPGMWYTNNYMANFAYTRIFTPLILNEFRVTAQRNNNIIGQPAADKPKPADLGIGIISDHPTGPTRLEFTDSGLIVGFSYRGPTDMINNTFAWSDTLSWVKGRHSLKFGGYVSAYQNNTAYDYYVNGAFIFYGTSGGAYSTNEFADFLMGVPDEYSQFPSAPSNIRSRSYAAFGQDEWHVNKNFVLTLGLRYEYNQPKFDTQNRSFSLLWGAQSGQFTNAPRGLLFPGDANAPNGANFPDRNDFAPRFGFAWDPGGNGKTSVRGGFGMFYDVLKGEDNLQFNGQAPFFGYSDLVFDSGLSSNPTKEPNLMTQPFIAAGQPNPFPSKPPAKNIDFDAAGFIPFGGGGVYFINPHLRMPYIYQYNLSIQRELAKNLTLETSYVGNSSHKLTTLVDANPFVLGTTHRLFNTQAGTTDSSYSYLDTFDNFGVGNYNSFQMSLQRKPAPVRILGTTYFVLSYTYGHSIDRTSGFRSTGSDRVPYYNHSQFRGSSDYDVRHRLTYSGGWDLPFEQWWKPNRLTRGWSLYPILSYRSGFPLDILGGLSRNRKQPGPSAVGDANIIRANLVGSSITILDPQNLSSLGGRTGNYYFNPTNFSKPALAASSMAAVTNASLRSYGTLGRNSFYGPGRFNFDLALAKTTPLVKERVAMEFRVEAFNIFNMTEFKSPNTSISDPAFGQISSTYDPRIMQFAIRLTF
jgi:outer membrane receptor protein involved in Fe transport